MLLFDWLITTSWAKFVWNLEAGSSVGLVAIVLGQLLFLV